MNLFRLTFLAHNHVSLGPCGTLLQLRSGTQKDRTATRTSSTSFPGESGPHFAT
jgi:hypothetical protein